MPTVVRLRWQRQEDYSKFKARLIYTYILSLSGLYETLSQWGRRVYKVDQV